jgi:hypothetical protein
MCAPSCLWWCAVCHPAPFTPQHCPFAHRALTRSTRICSHCQYLNSSRSTNIFATTDRYHVHAANEFECEPLLRQAAVTSRSTRVGRMGCTESRYRDPQRRDQERQGRARCRQGRVSNPPSITLDFTDAAHSMQHHTPALAEIDHFVTTLNGISFRLPLPCATQTCTGFDRLIFAADLPPYLRVSPDSAPAQSHLTRLALARCDLA